MFALIFARGSRVLRVVATAMTRLYKNAEPTLLKMGVRPALSWVSSGMTAL
jgi:hypothetical protein